MRVAVLGGGFGLYGYLPALLSLGHEVVLLERYRPTIAGRSDLRRYLDDIAWQPEEDDALDRAEALVVARRPDDQRLLAAHVLAKPQLRRLVLEKPLASSPAEASRLQTGLEASGKVFRIGYTFPLTPWAQRLTSTASASRTLNLVWRFRAHHYAINVANWKRSHAAGGGALRFYGIQVITVLARMGYDAVASSVTRSAVPGEVETWEAVFMGHGLGPCSVTIESNAAHRQFVVEAGPLSVDLADPFEELPRGDLDRRVPILAALCREALGSEMPSDAWSAATVALWQRVEQANVHRRV